MSKHLWYFAYGSNLKASRMKEREISIVADRTGYINNYTFSYSKIGADDTGKGNIQPQQNSKVWGAFYRITVDDFNHLHKNYEIGYRQLELTGISNGDRIEAKSFIALSERINYDLYPSKKYHDLVLTGAREHGLPEQYIDILKQI